MAFVECCNQAANNYATNLPSSPQLHTMHNNEIEQIFLDLLAHNSDKEKVVSQFLSCVNMWQDRPRVTRVGNKETRKPRKIIDYSDLPIVKLLKESKMSVPISFKRKNTDDENADFDETDSCFDPSKRFKPSSTSQPHTKKEAKLMTELDLWKITNKYPNLNEYHQISKALGIDQNDLLNIESKHLRQHGSKECLYQILICWRLQQPENCSRDYFMEEILANKLDKSVEFVNDFKSRLVCGTDLVKNRAMLDLYCKDSIGSFGNKLGESDLWVASGIMAEKWRWIGRGLGLAESELISIEAKFMEREGMRECCYQMMLVWSQSCWKEASVEGLCMGLIEMKLNLFSRQFVEAIVI